MHLSRYHPVKERYPSDIWIVNCLGSSRIYSFTRDSNKESI